MDIQQSYLVQGEHFIIDDKVQNTQPSLPDNEINAKYKKGEIRIITEQARYPLDTIATMLDSMRGNTKKYILNPEYQRRKRWDNGKKSRLIESFIINVPIPPIFLYEIKYSLYEVMDGLQRLTAIYDFYKGKFALEGLTYWEELNGKKYQELPDDVRRGIDRRYLSSIVLLRETAKSKEEEDFLKQMVFERLNSGGEKLTAQETRNALYSGKFNSLCMRLAQNDIFRKMWQLPLESEGEDKLLESESYRTMQDVELVLRFFAYRHIDKLTQTDKFLDNYLKQANDFSDETLKELEHLFIETTQLVYDIFKDKAFIPASKKRASQKPARFIYDPMMQVFAKNINHKKELLDKKDEIKTNLYKGNVDNNSLFDARYTNRSDVEKRISYFQSFLEQYIS